MKNQYIEGELPKKREGGLGQFADLDRSLQKRDSDVFEEGRGAFLMTPWLIGIKYPKQILLCCTNTVITMQYY